MNAIDIQDLQTDKGVVPIAECDVSRMLSVVLTYKCDGGCPYCYISELGYKRNYELKITSTVLMKMLTFRSVKLTGGEPLLHPYIFDLVGLPSVNYIFSNLYDTERLDQVLMIKPTISIGTTFQGTRHTGRPRETDRFYETLLRYKKNIKKICYVFFAENYDSVEQDLELIKKIDPAVVEPIWYFTEKSKEFVLGLPKQEQKKFLRIIEKYFPDMLETSGVRGSKSAYYMGPFDERIRTTRIVGKDMNLCNDCYISSNENCVNCAQYFDETTINNEVKHRYKESYTDFLEKIRG